MFHKNRSGWHPVCTKKQKNDGANPIWSRDIRLMCAKNKEIHALYQYYRMSYTVCQSNFLILHCGFESNQAFK